MGEDKRFALAEINFNLLKAYFCSQTSLHYPVFSHTVSERRKVDLVTQAYNGLEFIYVYLEMMCFGSVGSVLGVCKEVNM